MNEFQYEYSKLSSRVIISDPDYQRQVDYARVKKIVSNFNENLVNPIKVSYRDGKYYVFDGQHTLKALILHNNNKDLMVRCKVYRGMTKEDEARLFAEQNGISRIVESNQKLNSLYVAKDKDVVEFKKTIEDCGLICDFKKGSSYARLICYSTAYSIFQKHGKEQLKKVLDIIVEAWQGEPASVTKEIVTGIDVFTRVYADEYDKKKLVKKLQAVSPLTITRDGKASSYGGAKRFAAQILNYYNKGATSKRLENKLL